MSNEFGLTNDGPNIKEIPVESKEPTLVSTPAETGKKDSRERTELEKQVDAEIIAKGEKAVEDFDETQAITVPAKKKRGRPSKKDIEETKPMKEWYCSTCREVINEKSIMKIGAGEEGRYAAFCGQCQRSLGFIHPDLDDKIANLIKNNPTK